LSGFEAKDGLDYRQAARKPMMFTFDKYGISESRLRRFKSTSIFLMLVGLVALTGVMSGCAPQLNRIESSVQVNQDEISKLQSENKHLMQEVQAMGALLRMDRDAGTETSAMRLAKLSQVATRMDQLLQKLDDNAEYMRALSARVDLLATRQGIPTLGEYKPPTPSDVSGETLPEEGRSILAQAELDRNRGNLDLAREGFDEFLSRYGNSEAADGAMYWLGDIAYGEGDYSAALGHFDKMLTTFPTSERAPAALFKGRNCLMELDRTNEAWEWGGRLLSLYPDSAEAALLNAAEDQ
jgi:TolA-binding protein